MRDDEGGRRAPADAPSGLGIDDMAAGDAISARRRRLALVAILASVLSFSISLGGLVPWMALWLEARGTDEAVIGLVSAANPFGVMLAAPLVPRLLRRIGAADAILAAGLVTVASVVLLPVLDSVAFWLVLRLLSGFAGSVPWVVTETWINAVAGDRNRARVLALYGAVLSAGFTTGPLILTVTGTESVAAVFGFATLNAAALVPIFFVRHLAPVIRFAAGFRLSGMVYAMPVILAAGFLSGAVDTAFFSFLPIWGMRSGLEETFAVTVLSIFVAGNVLLQFPLGWLADMLGYRPVMLGCGVACILGPILALQAVEAPVVLCVVMFVWGGAAWGTYLVALAAIGRRFKNGPLAAANAAFVMVYTLANVTGPPLAGLAIEAWNPHGLIALMLGIGVAFTLLVLWRGASQGDL
jgi:MFS family permease